MSETPAPYGFPPQRDFASQYRRVFEAAACKTRAEPAAILDIRQSAIFDAERRRAVPSDWLITLFEKKRINPEWRKTSFPISASVLWAAHRQGGSRGIAPRRGTGRPFHRSPRFA